MTDSTEIIRLLIEILLKILECEKKGQVVGILAEPRYLSKLLTYINHWPIKYQPILLLFTSKILRSKQFLKSFLKVQGNETLFNILNKTQNHKHKLGILNCIKKSLNYHRFSQEYKKMGAIPILA